MEDAELLGYIKNYPEKDALREATRIFRKKSCPPLSSFRRDKVSFFFLLSNLLLFFFLRNFVLGWVNSTSCFNSKRSFGSYKIFTFKRGKTQHPQ